jgi:hypothetical protein
VREQELEAALTGMVPRDMHGALQARLAQQEEHAARLAARLAHQEEMAAVATRVAESFRAAKAGESKETAALRLQVRDLQAKDAPGTQLGVVQQQLLAVQLSEAVAVQRQQRAGDDMLQLQARVLRLERVCDDKDESVRLLRRDMALEQAYLRRTVQSLRLRASGTVPAERLARASAALAETRVRAAAAELAAAAAMEQRDLLGDRVAGLEDRLQQQQGELGAAVHEAVGGGGGSAAAATAAKLTSWHTKMADLRVNELHLTRALQRERDAVAAQKTVVARLESTLVAWEGEQVNQLRDFEERQMAWQDREAALVECVVCEQEKKKRNIFFRGGNEGWVTSLQANRAARGAAGGRQKCRVAGRRGRRDRAGRSRGRRQSMAAQPVAVAGAAARGRRVQSLASGRSVATRPQ